MNPSAGTGRGKPRYGLGDGGGARDGDDGERYTAQLPLRTDFFEAHSLLSGTESTHDGQERRQRHPIRARIEEGIPHRLILPTALRRALWVRATW